MALEMQTTHLPVSSGLSEGVDPVNAGPEILTIAENVRFTKEGLAKKRYGHTLVASYTGVTGGWGTTDANTGEGRLVANRDRLLWLDGVAIHQHAVGADTFSTKCLAPRFTGTSQPRAGTNKVMAHVDQCTAFSSAGREYVVVAYSEQQTNGAWGGSVFVKVFDATTSAEVNTTGAVSGTASNTYQLNSTVLDAHNVQLAAIGSSQHKVACVWADYNSGDVFARVLDIDTMVWGSEATLFASNLLVGGCSNRLDAKPLGAMMGILYQTTGYLVVLRKFSVSGTTLTLDSSVSVQDLSAGPTVACGFGLTPVIVGQTAPETWCTWGYDNGTDNIAVCRAVTVSSLATATAVTTVKTYTGSRASNFDYIVSSCSAVDPDNSNTVKLGFTIISGAFAGNTGSSSAQGHTTYSTNFHNAALSGGVATISDHGFFIRAKLLSNPFRSAGRWFAVIQKEPGWHVMTPAGTALFNVFGNSANTLSSTVANQSTTFVVDMVNGLEDACFFPRQGFMVGDNTLSWTAAGSMFYAYRHVTQFVRADKLRFATVVWDALQLRTSLHTVTLTTQDRYRYMSHSPEEGVYLSGGLVGYMDSRSFHPAGIPFQPGYVTQDEGAGPSTLSAGTSAAAVYEYVDNDGNVRYSEAASTVTLSGLLLPVDIYIPYCTSGWDLYNLKNRAGYLSTGNMHVVLYAGSSADSMYEIRRAELPPTFATYWGGITGTLQITAQPSTSANGKQNIYTQGGVLEHQIPPACIGMCEYRDRLVLLDHTKRKLWFSNVFVTGEGVTFSDSLTIDLPFDGAGLASFAGTLFVLGDSAVGTVIGDGPNATGSGGEFGAVDTLPYKVGCSNPASIVTTPLGVMFQSRAGIYLLDGGQSLRLIGEPVKDKLATYSTITSAIVHPTETVVLFTCTDGVGHGLRLVYDYKLDRWSSDTPIGGSTVLSQAVVGSSVYLLTSTGSVYKEDTTTHLDNSAWVAMSVEWASYKPGGVQGQSRLRCVGLLGDFGSAADLTISISYDDEITSSSSVYDYTKTFTNVTDWLPNLQFYPARQLGRSFKIKFNDATPTAGTVGTGAGIALSGVAVTAGVYSGMNRLDSSRRK